MAGFRPLEFGVVMPDFMKMALGILLATQVACGATRPGQADPQPPTSPGCSETPRDLTLGVRLCPLRIIGKHRPARTPSGKVVGHIGVDFAVCEGGHVIAIGDGIVGGVGGEDPDPEGTGGSLSIFHFVPGRGRVNVTYQYAHVINIRVREEEHVKRGQIIGDVWVSTNPDLRLEPHVHLHMLGPAPVEQEDPLSFLAGCMSQVTSDALIYPVEC